MNEQEDFWTNGIANQYRIDNDNFDLGNGVLAWQKMLSAISTQELDSFLECGANIGRNIGILAQVLPEVKANVIEINLESLSICAQRWKLHETFNGSIANSKFTKKFDLVFSCGVLIHVNPDDLLSSMEKMFSHSNRYILIAEYFSRVPETILYRGELNKLFKRDFGKLFLENFDVNVVDSGFLWSHDFESGGFDDITYWLFEKK